MASPVCRVCPDHPARLETKVLPVPLVPPVPEVPLVPSAPLAKTALTACPAPSVLPVPVDGVVNPALRVLLETPVLPVLLAPPAPASTCLLLLDWVRRRRAPTPSAT